MRNPRMRAAYSVLEILMDDDGDETVKQGNEVTVSAGQRSMIKFIEDSKKLIDIIKRTQSGKQSLKNVDITSSDAKLFADFIEQQDIKTANDWNNDANNKNFKRIFSMMCFSAEIVNTLLLEEIQISYFKAFVCR